MHVQGDLLNAREAGEQTHRDFSQQRIDCSPSKRNFHDNMSKQKLRTFSELGKTKTLCKESEKEIILEAMIGNQFCKALPGY